MSSQSFALSPIRARVQRPRSLWPRNSTSSEPSLELGREILRLRRAVAPVVPDDDRARAVVARRDHALEVGVLERVVLDVDGETLLTPGAATAPWDRPALEHPVHLEAQVVVEAPRGVLLDDEEPAGPGRPAPKGSGVRSGSRFRR